MRIVAAALSCGLAVTLVAIDADGLQTKSAALQSRLIATMECPPIEPAALSAAPIKCTYTRGEIGGVPMKKEEDTFVSDMKVGTSDEVGTAIATGNLGNVTGVRQGRGRKQYRGHGVIWLANGDKTFLRFEGTTELSNGAPTNGEGSWTFTGGTGKAKGISGNGRFKGTFADDRSATWQLNGYYQIGVGKK